ncbi:MAG: ferredoxin family protein [Bacteroides sp.]|nr:ferredoxin family protein [Bacteroides sp.]
MQNNRVTICACASRSFVDKDKIAEVAAALKYEGYDVNLEPDLCRKVMDSSPDIREMAAGTIVACHTRAVQSLLHWKGLEARQIIDIRNNTTTEVLSQLNISISFSSGKDFPDFAAIRQEVREFPVENGTDAWYPVLDKTQCSECGKCHDFCLFGVYTVENKQVSVVKPQNCKNNCPACARMCPNKAVIFPKYEKSPINGGTEMEESFNPEQMDIMYKERLRNKLQQRRASIPLLKKE